jgi:hypothetical protein
VNPDAGRAYNGHCVRYAIASMSITLIGYKRLPRKRKKRLKKVIAALTGRNRKNA